MSSATAPARSSARGDGASRRSRVLGVALFVLWCLVLIGALVLSWLNHTLKGQDFGQAVTFGFFSFVYAIVGTIIAARSAHPIGWLLLAMGIAFPFGNGLEQYTLFGLVTSPGSLPWATATAIAIIWLFAVAIVCLLAILLLFPTGRPRTSRWRAIVVLTPAVAFVMAVANSLTSNSTHGPWSDHGVNLRNPLAADAVSGIGRSVFVTTVPVLLAVGVAGVVNLVLRFRKSHGVERQQVKYLATVGVVVGVLFVVQMVLGPLSHLSDSVSNATWGIFFTVLMLGIPLSIGAAVLRYRLYDIDRIISRTLSYATVTAVLGGLYAVIAVVLPSSILGTRSTPNWIIAAGTLIAAAAFVPVRRRVQNAVDHRFNRHRYDAERTIDTFGARLRDEIDIDTLGAELKTIVAETMQPARVTLWVRRGSR